VKICIFGTSFLPTVGGKEYVMHHLANALVELGHDVLVLAKRVAWRLPGDPRSYELRRFGLPVRGSGNSGLDFAWGLAELGRARLLRGVEVVSCHSADHAGTIARYGKNLFRFPLVMTPHGLDIQRVPEIGYGMRLDPAWNRVITRNLHAADCVTAISRSVRQELDMVDPGRVVDLPNGIQTARFAGPRSEYLHRELALAPATRIVLSVGRNHVKKGYEYGIRALARLVHDYGRRDVQYVIIGKGVTKHAECVADNGVADYVSLIEQIPQEKLIDCYKSADLFFSPSIIEGLSLVSIEALAAGLPLVVTNVPGNDDVVRDTGCGVVVQDRDVDDMAAGLHALLTDDDRRAELARKATEQAARYDWARIATRYVEVFRRVIDGVH
jgi:glycosyltransferase involved in cell wall biosynthesis